MDEYPRTVKEAREQGAKFYFTGKPCPVGHIGLRWTSTMGCKECQSRHVATFLATEEGRQSQKESQRRYYQTHKEQRNQALHKWRQKNRERDRARVRRYAKSDKGRALRNWLNHVEEGAYAQARTEYGQDGVVEIYALARKLGLTVDHIDPLTHLLVCGLHNIYNLQLLSREENGRKGNNWPHEG